MPQETLSRSLGAVARQELRVEGETMLAEDIVAAGARFPLDPLIDGTEAITPLPLQPPRENPWRRA
jgi:hypothetical protein